MLTYHNLRHRWIYDTTIYGRFGKVHLTPLRWRHNDHAGVSNHQPHGCLLNRLFRRRSKKTSKLRVTGLCVGNSPGPVNSPHKGPVTRKMFPFDDVIMTPTRRCEVSHREQSPISISNSFIVIKHLNKYRIIYRCKLYCHWLKHFRLHHEALVWRYISLPNKQRYRALQYVNRYVYSNFIGRLHNKYP